MEYRQSGNALSAFCEQSQKSNAKTRTYTHKRVLLSCYCFVSFFAGEQATVTEYAEPLSCSLYVQLFTAPRVVVRNSALLVNSVA